MSAKKISLPAAARKVINIGLGVAQMVGEQIDTVVSDLEKKGHVNRAEGKKLARELLSEANSLQKSFSARVDRRLKRIVKSADNKAGKPKAKRRK